MDDINAFCHGLEAQRDKADRERDDARRERDELRTALTWLSGSRDFSEMGSAIVWEWLGVPRLLGASVVGSNYAPVDFITDRTRCVRAIQLMPWLLPALEKLEAQSEQWREQGKLIRTELNGEAKS